MASQGEQAGEGGVQLNQRQLDAAFWTPRVVGVIVFASSMTMLLMALKRRKILFHRMVIGKNNTGRSNA